jgi:Zinc carboxypeptidase
VFGGGVDPNRNYGAFWGGNGSSDTYVEQDYRGPGPFSEPESRNIRELVSNRQVTTLITNHTFSGLVLRPPGVAAQGTTVDEPTFKALGDSMAAENGYSSQYGYQLYDTTGTTEDWSYNATAGLGFTFEIGHLGFHPPYEVTVQEWEGTTDYATGGGNRAAYYKAQENTADPSKHSVIAGKASKDMVLRLTKSVELPTSQEGQTISDHLDSSMVVTDKKGNFEWHVNPSTSPLVAKSEGDPQPGEPSPSQQFSGGPDDPSEPCPLYFELPNTRDPSCWTDHPFEVPPDGNGINNEFADVEITWATPVSDWDLEIYRDSNGDGSSENEGEPVADSTSGQTTSELATLGPGVEPGRYVARVINYTGTEPYQGTVSFRAPDPFKPGAQEAYTLTCETPQGVVKAERQVFVARGERLALDLRKTCR